MLKKHDKVIVEAIKSVGLSPDIFERNTTTRYLELLHQNSGLRCVFSYMHADFNGPFIGRFNSLKNKDYFNEGSDVDLESLITFKFFPWLTDYIKPIVDDESEPDPWIVSEQQRDSTFDQIDDSDFNDFSKKERETIDQSLEKLQYLIEKNFELTTELKNKVEQELTYLSTANKKLNRRDWKAVAQKVIYDLCISITSNIIVDASKAYLRSEIPGIFWKVVREAFSIVIKISQ